MTVAALAVVIGRLLALVVVGVALRATGLVRAEDARPINNIIIYVGLPALVFVAVRPARLSWDLAIVAGIAWACGLVGLALAYAASKLLKLSRPAAGGLMLASALGNTGYIGYPVALGLLGDAGLVKAVFFDVFGTVALLPLVGLPIAAEFGASQRKANVVRDIASFPALIALLVALATRSVPVHPVVMDWLDLVAKLVVPLIMISLGVSLKPRTIGAYAVPIGVVVGLKLLLAPLVALVLGRALLGSDDAAVRLVVLQAGMPTMMLALVFGARFELDADLIAGAAVVTTAAAIVSIPLMQALVR